MTDYIWLIWDIAALALIVLCIRSCARKGFIRTVISFFAYIIALVGAKILSPIAAAYAYNTFVGSAIKSALQKAVENSITENSGFINAFAMPKFMNGFFKTPLDGGDWLTAVTSGVDGFVDTTLAQPVLTLLYGICFLIIFSVLVFVIRFIAKLFTGVYKIPVIGTINTFLGGILGAVQAVIFLFVGALAMGVLIQLTGSKLEWLNLGIIGDTYVVRVFFRILFPHSAL